MINEKQPVNCDMHKKIVDCEVVWKYTAQAAGTDYKEQYQFCSYECLLAWLVDDEKVLKLKLRRMNVDRAIRHPHSLQRAPNRAGDNTFVLDADPYVQKDIIEVLDFENMSREEMEKEFDKEEMDSLDSVYADDG